MSRRERQNKYSLTCPDDEWERASARAKRRGQSTSAFIVECALAVDPVRPGMQLALDGDEQRTMLDTTLRTGEQVLSLAGGEGSSVLESIRDRIAFLTRRAMLEMVLADRRDDLTRILAMRFGEADAEKKVRDFCNTMERGDRQD